MKKKRSPQFKSNFPENVLLHFSEWIQANDKYQQYFQSKNGLDEGQKQRKYMSDALGQE